MALAQVDLDVIVPPLQALDFLLLSGAATFIPTWSTVPPLTNTASFGTLQHWINLAAPDYTDLTNASNASAPVAVSTDMLPDAPPPAADLQKFGLDLVALGAVLDKNKDGAMARFFDNAHSIVMGFPERDAAIEPLADQWSDLKRYIRGLLAYSSGVADQMDDLRNLDDSEVPAAMYGPKGGMYRVAKWLQNQAFVATLAMTANSLSQFTAALVAAHQTAARVLVNPITPAQVNNVVASLQALSPAVAQDANARACFNLLGTAATVINGL